MIRGAIIGAALAAALPLPTTAEGFTIIDLGQTRDRETCIHRAEQVMERYGRDHGLGDLQVSEWIVFAYDLRPGDQDVTIICPVLGQGERFVNAFLNVHGETTQDEREATADAIEGYWFE